MHEIIVDPIKVDPIKKAKYDAMVKEFWASHPVPKDPTPEQIDAYMVAFNLMKEEIKPYRQSWYEIENPPNFYPLILWAEPGMKRGVDMLCAGHVDPRTIPAGSVVSEKLYTKKERKRLYKLFGTRPISDRR